MKNKKAVMMPGQAFMIGLIVGIAVLLAIIALGKVDICSMLIPPAPVVP